jgi:hypothetical protein
MLHVRIKMRLGGWAASSQNTDADTGVGGGGRQEFRPPVCYQRPALLTLMRVQAALKAWSIALSPTSLSACSSATKAFEAALKDSGS